MSVAQIEEVRCQAVTRSSSNFLGPSTPIHVEELVRRAGADALYLFAKNCSIFLANPRGLSESHITDIQEYCRGLQVSETKSHVKCLTQTGPWLAVGKPTRPLLQFNVGEYLIVAAYSQNQDHKTQVEPILQNLSIEISSIKRILNSVEVGFVPWKSLSANSDYYEDCRKNVAVPSSDAIKRAQQDTVSIVRQFAVRLRAGDSFDDDEDTFKTLAKASDTIAAYVNVVDSVRGHVITSERLEDLDFLAVFSALIRRHERRHAIVDFASVRQPQFKTKSTRTNFEVLHSVIGEDVRRVHREADVISVSDNTVRVRLTGQEPHGELVLPRTVFSSEPLRGGEKVAFDLWDAFRYWWGVEKGEILSRAAPLTDDELATRQQKAREMRKKFLG